MPKVATNVSSPTTKTTRSMKLNSTGCKRAGSVTPSRLRRLMEMAMAPTTIPTVSRHQIKPTALGRSCSLVRSITRAR